MSVGFSSQPKSFVHSKLSLQSRGLGAVRSVCGPHQASPRLPGSDDSQRLAGLGTQSCSRRQRTAVKETGNQRRANTHAAKSRGHPHTLLESAPVESPRYLSPSHIAVATWGVGLPGSSSDTLLTGAGHVGTLPSVSQAPDPKGKRAFSRSHTVCTDSHTVCTDRHREPSFSVTGGNSTEIQVSGCQPTARLASGPFRGQQPHVCSITSFQFTRVHQAHPLSQFWDIPPSQHQPSERPVSSPQLNAEGLS